MKNMKKIVLVISVLLVGFSVFAETKTIYVTRHGQRGDAKYQVRLKNLNEDRLMPKGEEQARRLGKYLKSKEFDGTIYVSPYYRTLQTATFAAEAFPELPMILEPRIQETAGLRNASGKVKRNKKCITRKEIKENFPNVKIPFGVKFPWRLENESQAQQDKRVSDMIDDLLKVEGDAFVVGHGGVMGSVIREMNKRGAEFPRKKVYNCCLYSFTFDTETGKVVSSSDETLNYLPDELITDNLAYMLLLPERNSEGTTEQKH